MNMFTLSLRYFKRQKGRTALTIIGVALAAALVSGTGILLSSFQHMGITREEKEEGTWDYRISQIPAKETADTLKGNALFQSAGIAATNNYLQVSADKNGYLNLYEYDPQALALSPLTVSKGRLPKNSGEIAIASDSLGLFKSGLKIGDKIALPYGTYDYDSENNNSGSGDSRVFSQVGNRSFTVVGILGGDGTQNFSFLSRDGIALTMNPAGKHVYSVYAQLKPGAGYSSVQKAVKDSGLNPKKNIFENGKLDWMGKSASTKVRNAVTGTFLLLSAIILSVTVLVIRNAFAMSVSEKISQIGTLRCIGAAPAHIRSLVLSQALLIFIISVPIGLACGTAAMWAVIAGVKSIDPQELAYLSLFPSVWPYIATAALTFFTVLFSAVFPARRAVKMSMIDAVRGSAVYRGDRIRVNRKGRVFGRIFGFPGLLASKNIRRNPKRFRTTELSIIISVALFVSVGGFAVGISKTIGRTTGGSDFEICANSSEKSGLDQLNEVNCSIKALPGVKETQISRNYSVDLSLPKARVPQKYLNVYKDFNGRLPAFDKKTQTLECGVIVMQVSRENYNSLKFSGTPPSYDELVSGNGALLCEKQTFVSSGGRIAYASLADYRPGDTLSLTQSYLRKTDPADLTYEKRPSRQINVKIAGLLDENPWFSSGSYHYGGASEFSAILVVPEQAIAQFDPSASIPGASENESGEILSIRYKNGTEIKKSTDSQVTSIVKTASRKYGFSYSDIFLNNQSSRNQALIMGVFVYGFMAVIFIICCVNIFNTVNANLLTRRREIAMTRAVGMSRRQLTAMVLLECVLYGVIGTLWGSVVGVPLQLALTRLFGHVILADVESPLSLIPAALLASSGIGILAGLTPLRRMLHSPIIEEIRGQE